MKVCLASLGGLADTFYLYFAHPDFRSLLPKIAVAYEQGIVDEVVILSRFLGPFQEKMWNGMPFPVTIMRAEECEEIEKDAGNFSTPDRWRGCVNCTTKPPVSISRLQADPDRFVSDISSRPELDIPEDYCFIFMPSILDSGSEDRLLSDMNIKDLVSRALDLDSVVVNGIDPPLTFGNILWLAKNAKVIISPISFMRVAQLFFGVQVIELYETSRSHILPDWRSTQERTEMEYANGSCGLNSNGESFWFRWPEDSSRLFVLLRTMKGNGYGLITTDRIKTRTGLNVLVRKDTVDTFLFNAEVDLSQGVYAINQEVGEVRTVIDIGAHIGAFSLQVAQRYPKAEVYAFELFPDNFKILMRNIDLMGNGGKNIHAFNVAATGDVERFGFDFHKGKNTGGGGILPGTIPTIPFPKIRISEFIRETITGPVDILKLDCEGSEHHIIADLVATGIITRVRNIMMEMHWPEKSEGFMGALHSIQHDYNVVWFRRWGCEFLHACRLVDRRVVADEFWTESEA